MQPSGLHRGGAYGRWRSTFLDTDMRGWGFTFGPDEVDRLVWYAIDGQALGSTDL